MDQARIPQGHVCGYSVVCTRPVLSHLKPVFIMLAHFRTPWYRYAVISQPRPLSDYSDSEPPSPSLTLCAERYKQSSRISNFNIFCLIWQGIELSTSRMAAGECSNIHCNVTPVPFHFESVSLSYHVYHIYSVLRNVLQLNAFMQDHYIIATP